MPLIKNPNNPLNRPIALSNLFWIVLALFLVAGNIFFYIRYNSLQDELRRTQAVVETQKLNDKVLEFTKLFIKDVLEAETEVDFETRLKIENAVRNLDDEEVLAQWQKFVGSETEIEAQDNVKSLLETLVNKIKLP